MVASILKIVRMPGWVGWLLLWLCICSVGGTLHAEEGRSQTSAPSSRPSLWPAGSLSEEDLPAEEAQTDTPAVSVESDPILPQPLTTEETPLTTTALPPLPTPATSSPQDLVALRFVGQGKGALAQGDLDRAREQFQRAVAVAPLQPYSYYFLGRVAFALGEHQQALAFVHKAELLFAPDDRAWLSETAGLAGAIYEDLGDYAQARAAYQRCLQLVPSNLSALSALARLSPEESLPSDTLPQ